MSTFCFALIPPTESRSSNLQIDPQTNLVRIPNTQWSIVDQPTTLEARDCGLKNIGLQSQVDVLGAIKQIVDLACNGVDSTLVGSFQSYMVRVVLYGRRAVEPTFRLNDPYVKDIRYTTRCSYIRAVKWLAEVQDQIIKSHMGLEALIHAPISITRAERLSDNTPESFVKSYPVLPWERNTQYDNFYIPLLVLLTYDNPCHDNYIAVSRAFSIFFSWKTFQNWYCSYNKGVLGSLFAAATTGGDDPLSQQHGESTMVPWHTAATEPSIGATSLYEMLKRPAAEGRKLTIVDLSDLDPREDLVRIVDWCCL